jgi:hypothetical protein
VSRELLPPDCAGSDIPLIKEYLSRHPCPARLLPGAVLTVPPDLVSLAAVLTDNAWLSTWGTGIRGRPAARPLSARPDPGRPVVGAGPGSDRDASPDDVRRAAAAMLASGQAAERSPRIQPEGASESCAVRLCLLTRDQFPSDQLVMRPREPVRVPPDTMTGRNSEPRRL